MFSNIRNGIRNQQYFYVNIVLQHRMHYRKLYQREPQQIK